MGILQSQCPLSVNLEAGLREGEFTWTFFFMWKLLYFGCWACFYLHTNKLDTYVAYLLSEIVVLKCPSRECS
jgi:hypothetical protein